jgi:hypothetical protein
MLDCGGVVGCWCDGLMMDCGDAVVVGGGGGLSLYFTLP